jgi:hypothetical protein
MIVFRLLPAVCDKHQPVSQRQAASCQHHSRIAKTRAGVKDSMTRARGLGGLFLSMNSTSIPSIFR